MMNETEIVNAELTLASIRSDTIQAADDLSGLLQEQKAVRESIVLEQAELETAKADMVRANKELDDERTRMRAERKAHEDWVERNKRELEVLKQQKKEAMAELKRLNDWIFSGEARQRELEGKVADFEVLSAKKKSLEGEILDLIAQKELATTDRNQVKLETSLALDASEVALNKIKTEREEAEKALASATKEREQEEIKLSDYRNERAQLKKDTDVVVARIEEKFGEAFPGLVMKL
jgi:chromosome segregation ATPase